MSATLASLLTRPLAEETAIAPRLSLRRSSRLLALEQRFMFDGAAAADAAHAAGDAAVLAQIAAVPAAVEVRAADPTLDNGKKEAVLVDTSVADYKTLEAGIAAGIAIIEFDGSKDGLAQIANWAASQSGYDAIHILSHGSEATLNLGTSVLTDSRLSDSLVQAELAELGHALKAGGDLLLYGCDLAANSDGAQFLGDLSAATGADVAASTDATGAAAKDGDWVLEANSGSIDVNSLAVLGYQGLLATNITFDAESGTISGLDNTQTTVTENFSGETLNISAHTIIYSAINNLGETVAGSESFLFGYTGNPAALEDSVTFSLSGGHSFDLASIKIANNLTAATGGGTGETLTFTTNKGSTTVNLGIGDGTSSLATLAQTFTFSGAAFTGITSFTITAADSNFQIIADSIVLQNITAPTTTVSTASLSTDTGTAGDFITNTASQTISGSLSANLATGEKVQVSYDGGSNWSDAGTYTVGSSSWSTSTTLSGSNTFMARVTNANGSSTAFSHTYTLDTTAPSAPLALDLATASDSGSSNSDNITNVTTPTITGTAEANSIVKLYDTDGTTELGSATADGSGNWSIASSALSAGSHTLSAQATDAAGNTSSASAGLAITIDTTAPSVPNAPDLDTASDSGSSNTDNTTSVTTPTFSGTAEANSTVKLYNSDGTTELGSATADVSGNWSIASIALSAGTHTISVKATDAAGNTSAASATLSVIIDTTAPSAPSTPDLTNASDSGSSATDNLTNLATPTFSGTGENGATVTLFKDANSNGVVDSGENLGTATVASGTWSITTGTLADGTYSIKALQTDATGNVSAASSGLSVTIDTSAPNAPSALDLATASDSGSSNSDNITNVTTPTITGTAEANSTVKLYDTDGTTLLGTATADGSGNWSIASSALSAGSHTLTAKATDAAGNTSSASAGLAITIDTTAPTTPTVNSLSTANLTPTLTGTATLGTGETLTVTVGGATYNVTPSGGNWSLDLSSATPASGTLSLSAGNTYSVTATASDAAGNSVSDASSNELSVLTGPPPTTTGNTVAISNDSGLSGTDLITNVASQTVSGTLTAATITGETVEVSVDGGNTWSTATNPVGSSSFSISTTLSAGTHALQVRVANANGGGTPYSRNYTLDTTAPTNTVASASFSNDSGTGGDFITNNTSQTISGTLSANLASGEIVQVSLDNGATWTAATATVGQNTWSLAGQTLTSSNTLQVRVWDTAGNSGTVYSQAYVLDTSTPSAPSTPDLATASDGGASSTDNITNATTPTFTGTGENGATVTLFKDANSNGVVDSGESLGTATVSGGAWSISSSTLAAGAYTIKAIQTDAAGNASAASSGLAVTIDTTAPNAPTTPDLAAASDSGVSDTDNKTNTTTPTLTGTAEANSTVKLYDTDGTTLLGTATADGSGNWSITTSTLSAGSHTLTAKATDAAGNTSAASSGLTVAIDTTAPTVSNVTASTADGSYKAGDTVSIQVNFSENVTVTGTPQLTLETGSTDRVVNYTSGSGSSTLVFTYTVQAGDTSADLDYLITSALALNGGTIKDAAGNDATLTLASPGGAGSLGANKAIVIDTTAPNTTISNLGLNDDTGLNGSDFVTTNNSQTISATLSGALSAGDKVYGSVDGGSNWTDITNKVSGTNLTWTGATLTAGTTSIKLKVTDAAGNDGTVTNQPYTVDGAAPTIASATVNGSTVVLTYNETLASGVTPQIGEFGEYKVKVGGNEVKVNAIAYDAATKTVTLTLDTPVAATDTVTVSYTADGTVAHEVQDVAGNLAGNLTNQAVTNNTVATQVPPPVPVADPTPPASPTPVPPPPPPPSSAPVVVVTPPSFDSAIVLRNNPVGDNSLTGIVSSGTPGDAGKVPIDTTPTLTRGGNNGFQVAVKSGGFSSDGLLVNRPFADQTLTAGGRTEVTVPADTFSHTSPNAIVTLTAKLANGAPLPAWVSFDAQKGKFVMQPPPGVKGDIAIRLVARDNTGREVVTTFKVHVGAATERNAQLLPGRPGLSEQLQIAAAQGDSLAALGLALRDHAAAVRG